MCVARQERAAVSAILVGLVIALAALLLPLAGRSAEEVFVDPGACPGESCHYGSAWVARAAVALREAPSDRAPAIGTLPDGTEVTTLTGEVHTRPARFVVREARHGLEPGDEVLVYTYLGETAFRVRHNGELEVVELGFSPWGGTTGKRCEVADGRCFGYLESELEFVWWVRVRARDGTTGWTRQHGDFDRRAD